MDSTLGVIGAEAILRKVDAEHIRTAHVEAMLDYFTNIRSPVDPHEPAIRTMS